MPRLAAEAALALLVAADGPKQVYLAEGRPVGMAEILLAVELLPEDDGTHPHHATGPDDKVPMA